MIKLQNGALRLGGKLLFENVTVTVFTGQKVGLVGLNGSGKSSLFGLLLGKIAIDSGECYVSKHIKISHLAQEVPYTSATVLQYAMEGDRELATLYEKLKIAEAKQDNHAVMQIYNHIYELHGYDLEARAAKILLGLGFASAVHGREVNKFSGGWKMRLNLAQVLLSRADLLLLDEPTNYLDLDAILWLEDWLKNYHGTFLIISHDRDFLDNTVTDIFHISDKGINVYNGNYSSFEQQRAARLLVQRSLHEKQVARIEHLTRYIDRFRAKATKARQAQSRMKILEKMKLVTLAHSDSPFSFKFANTKLRGSSLIAMSDATISHGTVNILDGVNFNINFGDAIGILGANGAGKSTFLKVLAGVLKVKSGSIVSNPNIKIGYFAQHQVEQLDMQASPMEILRSVDPRAQEQQLRTFLGSFGFQSDSAYQITASFSGGEKARLALAILVWQKPNLLLLDEPTNHLDLEMRMALAQALQSYEGALVLVAHDRYLLSSSVNEFYVVADRKISKFDGALTDYQPWLVTKSPTKSIKCSGAAGSSREFSVEKKESKIMISTRSKRLAFLEREITKIYAAKKLLEEEIADFYACLPYQDEVMQDLLKKKAQLEKSIAGYEMEWMKLQE